jgi:hypothetical protein
VIIFVRRIGSHDRTGVGVEQWHLPLTPVGFQRLAESIPRSRCRSTQPF